MKPSLSLLSLASCGLLLVGFMTGSTQEPAKTGPQTEKRFPPLQVPVGFKATLFACDPMIEYPSVIAQGPRPGTLFVAIDYMTGLGTDITRRDEIRLLEDTDGDGYADKATVVATGFNSIQGLAYHDGTLYVMHAPYLSAVRFPNAAGKADERRDLLTGIGLPPEKDQIRLHNANGVVVGHDGWLYLAVGDHGCEIARPEGDKFVLHGGGILRCRPDGRDLHLFAGGLRNIYDVALDEDLNVFVRDNENDGGDYKIRVIHSFFGADHGYPYIFWERPDEALTPLADLGLGSSAGVACYLERQFPGEYRGNLFACEWGRSVVRYRLDSVGSTFATPKEIDFAAGAPNDPYGFKPTDLVVDRDGALFIADWADGQRPKRGRGRIYRVTYTGASADKPAPPPNDVKLRLDPVIAKLNSDSYEERWQAQAALERRGKEVLRLVEQAVKQQQVGVRGRLHAVWIIAHLEGIAATDKLLALAKSDPNPRVQTQALRALGDLVDPILVKHRLDAGRGDPALATRLAALAEGRDPRVLREVIVTLGRLRWPDAPAWLHAHVIKPDPGIQHAAQQTLRQSGNWPAILKLLDEPSSDPFRAITRRAVAEQFDKTVVDGLMERLARESDAGRRREYADLLARVCKKPAEPWTFWGFRPPPRPAPTLAWERTEAITAALDRVLTDPDRTVRLEILRRMLREKIPAQTATLGKWLREDRDPDRVGAILQALQDRPGAETRLLLEEVVRSKDHARANRVQAVAMFVSTLDADSEARLLRLAEDVEDGPVLAGLLEATAARPKLAANPLLLRKVASPDADVRAQAIATLADRQATEAADQVCKLLDDRDARVRSAAAQAAGKLGVRTAADALLKLAADEDAAVRRSSLEALRRLREPRVVPVAVKALADRETVLPALDALAELGGPDQAGAVTEAGTRNPSADILTAAGRVLTRWAARDNLTSGQRETVTQALGEIHGKSGVLFAWRAAGSLRPDAAQTLLAKVTAGQPLPADARMILATGIDARIALGRATRAEDTWLASADLVVTEPAAVDWFAASTGLATIWLNGKIVYQREKPGVIGPYPDRFEASLPQGRSSIVVRLTGVKDTAEFQVRFRRKTATADQERYSRAALSRAGNPAAGRQIFLNAEKSLCVKCHRVGDIGEKIGPELTGLGSRFSKIYIVESILEPSRTIAPSFETIAVLLKNGKSVSGVKIAETDTTITLADNQAQKHLIPKADIEDQQKQPVSTMPDGAEKRLTEDEFVDLVSFLANLKETRAR
ncbi:hypothetical protein AYO44_01130 [Planctomycetaceae bacterium SCGC AG-212-F19]|nr:hypothetical protein AYO44_01130 [Planctomycetaceae bacterium SCGC AG-212-F19]